MRNIPTVTKNLLIINFLAFLAMIALKPAMGVDLNDLLGLHFFMASDFHIYQLFTYMFMHAGWEHIIMNMFMLWMFGAVIERTFGEKRFLFYYIFCGLGAGILQDRGCLRRDLCAFTGFWHAIPQREIVYHPHSNPYQGKMDGLGFYCHRVRICLEHQQQCRPFSSFGRHALWVLPHSLLAETS